MLYDSHDSSVDMNMDILNGGIVRLQTCTRAIIIHHTTLSSTWVDIKITALYIFVMHEVDQILVPYILKKSNFKFKTSKAILIYEHVN